MPDITNSTDDSSARAVALVPEVRRMEFLPLLFGRQHVLVAEMTVYHLMERLSPLDYRGGLWDFYERDGRPLYLAPTSKPRFQI
uniref:antirestriction protein n=3 Tax=Bacteria TaxID=2 RepID=UPI0038B2AF3A